MSVSDLLNASGGQSFKFDTVGASVTGTVVAAEVVQKKNFDTGEPEHWSDGQPVQQIRVSLQTTMRDPANPDDDGVRNVYIKGWGDQLRELRRAVKEAGASDLEPGGKFTATYTGDGQLPPGKRGFPPKVYAYSYVKPSGTSAVLALGQTEPAVQAPTAAPAVPAAVPAGAPTPETLAAFAAWQAANKAS